MLKIGDKEIVNSSVYVIAEAGSNHNGDIEKAYSLVDIAVDAGADCVKFQSVSFDTLTSDYSNADLRSAVDTITLDNSWYRKLSVYCERHGIDFMSTPTYPDAVDELFDVGVKAFKIASMDLTNIPFLRYVASKGLPIILSRGMSSMSEISCALNSLSDVNCALLHCIADYPALPSQVNLRQIQSLSSAFGIPIGFSDHTESIVLPSAAVTLGATIVEKHFTDDRSQDGFDHFYALDPNMLKAMIKGIRETEVALGSSVVQLADSEVSNKLKWQRSIVASSDIEVGQVFTISNLTTKRPGTGISPLLWDSIIGQKATKPIKSNQILQVSDFT